MASSSSSSSCVTISHSSALRPSTRFQPLTWNPISRLALSKRRSDESSFWATNKTLRYNSDRDTRKSFVVCANTSPGVPPASGPPPSSGNPMSWIIGLVVSFILPFFSSKWGPLLVIKNKLENAVQTVEDIAEAVETVAENVDKIAEDFGDDLPQGKLRDLVEKVEHLAEKTAKTADCLDDAIDKVQDAGDKMDDIVESAIKDAKSSKTVASSIKKEN